MHLLLTCIRETGQHFVWRWSAWTSPSLLSKILPIVHCTRSPPRSSLYSRCLPARLAVCFCLRRILFYHTVDSCAWYIGVLDLETAEKRGLKSSVKEYQKYKILTLRKGLCPPLFPPLSSSSSYFTSSGLPGMLKGRKKEEKKGFMENITLPPSPPPSPLSHSLSHSLSPRLSLPLSVNAQAKSFYHHFQSLSELLSAPALLSEPGRCNFPSPLLLQTVPIRSGLHLAGLKGPAGERRLCVTARSSLTYPDV